MRDTDFPVEPYAAALIRRKAQQLIGKAGFTPSDCDDIEQELLLEYRRRRGKFDAARGHLHAFIKTVIERCTASLLETRRRAQPIPVGSLQVTVTTVDGPTELAQLIGPREHLRRIGSTPRNDQELLDLQIDIRDLLATLAPEERELAARLGQDDVAQFARDLGMPRSTLRDRIRRLHRRFAEAGLGDSLPNCPPG